MCILQDDLTILKEQVVTYQVDWLAGSFHVSDGAALPTSNWLLRVGSNLYLGNQAMVPSDSPSAVL